ARTTRWCPRWRRWRDVGRRTGLPLVRPPPRGRSGISFSWRGPRLSVLRAGDGWSRGGEVEAAHGHLAAEGPGGVVEDAEAVAHEELPGVVQREGRAEAHEGAAVGAVGEAGLPAGARPDVGVDPQPELAARDVRARRLGAGAGGLPRAVHGQPVGHHDPADAVVAFDADPGRLVAQHGEPGAVAVGHLRVVEFD